MCYGQRIELQIGLPHQHNNRNHHLCRLSVPVLRGDMSHQIKRRQFWLQHYSLLHWRLSHQLLRLQRHSQVRAVHWRVQQLHQSDGLLQLLLGLDFQQKFVCEAVLEHSSLLLRQYLCGQLFRWDLPHERLNYLRSLLDDLFHLFLDSFQLHKMHRSLSVQLQLRVPVSDQLLPR